MATLVTGGTGFVGSNIVKTLAQRGHEVVCFDRVAPDHLVRKYIEPWAERVTFVQGDILNMGDLERAANLNITKIVHAAAFNVYHPDIERDGSRSVVDVNVAGTANLLELARGLPLERFLYVSSAAVYGEGRSLDEVLCEDTGLYPSNLYGITKYVSELVTRRYGELHGIQTVSVRLTSAYGPMERATSNRALVSILCEWSGNLVRGEPIKLGDRPAGADHTYVADTAAGVCTILDSPSLSYDVYNLSAGRWITVEELIETLRELRPSLQVEDEPPKEQGAWRPSAPHGPIDVRRLKEDLGFSASFDLTRGIEHYLQWREDFSFRE